VQHFSAEGIPGRTIYNIISRYHNELPFERKHGSGRKNKLSSWNNLFTIIQKLPADMQLKSLNALLVWFTKH